MIERNCWLGFAMCNGIGPVKFQSLVMYFESAANAWEASQSELQKAVGPAAAALIVNHRQEFSPDVYIEKLRKHQVEFLTFVDPDYPKLLSRISKPPYVLYTKGNKALLNDSCLAVVGTRKITDYGREITNSLTSELAAAGYVIVSGLALGVDAIAHKAATSVNGKTIAVLGCGVDCCNPRENTLLYSTILEKNGLIVSEYGLGAAPNPGTFPARNRIIAGLSVGVLVTEGAEDSGSLITANNAFESGRMVFAVPGPITSSVSRGPIALIAKGAKIVTSSGDILKELEAKSIHGSRSIKNIKGDTKEEQAIIDLLTNQQLHFDELVKKTGLDSAHVGTILSLMEMKGMIRTVSSGMFGLVT